MTTNVTDNNLQFEEQEEGHSGHAAATTHGMIENIQEFHQE